VAALGSLLLDEGPLHRPGVLGGTETLEGRDLPALEQHDGGYAGQRRCAVNQHCARAALAETATELRGIKLQIVSQDVEQRSIRVRAHVVRAAIDLQLNHESGSLPHARWPRRPSTVHSC